ncbi:MAG: hypothetical protein ABSE93_18045 [Terriglobia bacterium]|jgi:hypothetical protein
MSCGVGCERRQAILLVLTPYAVRLRYDDSFWPTLEVARQAQASGLAIRDFVLSRLPKEILKAEE